jgi:signal transduction histidine kinase
MTQPRPPGKIRFLRNILLTIITLAAFLSLYNVFIIYPSFTRLLVQYTKSDAIRATRYVSTTLAMPDGGIPTEQLDVHLKDHLREVESSLELIKLKIYTLSGETIYSTDASDIGIVNHSEYFKEMAAQGSNQALLVKRDTLSLEGVKVGADVVEVYVPLMLNDGAFGGAVEIYYDISQRKLLMDNLVYHSTTVLAALVGGLILVVFLLFFKETRVTKERRFARQEVQESQEKLSTILNAIPDLILLLDSSYSLVWSNQRAWVFWGNELKPANHGETISLVDKGWLPDGLLPCFEQGHTLEEEIDLVDTKGRRFSFSCTANVVTFEKDGRPQLVLLMYRDITEKKSLQAETVRAGQLASIGELAAGVAHEINNPVNGIINCSQLLLDNNELPTSTRDIARRMFDAGDRVAMIVRSLLSFARVDTHEPVEVHINQIIQDTLDFTAVQIEKDSISLTVDIDDNLPAVFIHPHQIQQVFLNILSNSRYAVKKKFLHKSGQGEISLRVSGTISEQGSTIDIVFFDNGTGIPAYLLERICNPFFTSKPAGEGTGLGLSISQSIIEDHGGTLLVSSTEGQHTIVNVRLPAIE